MNAAANGFPARPEIDRMGAAADSAAKGCRFNARSPRFSNSRCPSTLVIKDR
jgi:hypothetical protein